MTNATVVDQSLPAGARPTDVGTAPVQASEIANLFEPYRLNDSLQLKNRIVLAPCTRCRAVGGLVPTAGVGAARSLACSSMPECLPEQL